MAYNSSTFSRIINFDGKVAVVTGAGGAIGGAIADGLVQNGASVSIFDISEEAARKKAAEISSAGGQAMGIACDVLDSAAVARATQQTVERFGTIDILVNGAGGSRREATTSPDLSFFDIAADPLMKTLALNYASAVIPCQHVGRIFARKKKGVVLNIASIAGMLPLTNAVGYSNGKAAVINFTQWLAVHMAKEYSPDIRVNALAPGFVLTEQNRFLLLDQKTGQPTERARTILRQVPMGRYGEPEEMVGAALWLVSDGASFVTGITVPIDGGLTSFSGV